MKCECEELVRWWRQRKSEVFEENPVAVPLCPSKMSHDLARGLNMGLRSHRMAARRLNHGTVQNLIVNPWIKKLPLQIPHKSNGHFRWVSILISRRHLLAISRQKMFWTNGLEKRKHKNLLSLGTLRCAEWQFLDDVSGPPSIQSSRIKQTKKKHTRNVSVLFPNTEIMNIKNVLQTYICELPTKQLEIVANRDLPFLHAKNTIALASFRLSWKKTICLIL